MTDVKGNFKTMHTNIDCNLCFKGMLQTDAHLLDCTKILENCSSLADEVEYKDIFGNVEKQLKITQISKTFFEVKLILDEQIS